MLLQSFTACIQVLAKLLLLGSRCLFLLAQPGEYQSISRGRARMAQLLLLLVLMLVLMATKPPLAAIISVGFFGVCMAMWASVNYGKGVAMGSLILAHEVIEIAARLLSLSGDALDVGLMVIFMASCMRLILQKTVAASESPRGRQ